jgi:hypothetical protein
MDPDPDPVARGMDQDPAPAPDPSIIMPKIVRKTLIPAVCDFFSTFYLCKMM